MKYQVYAALIATASAGPWANRINSKMPSKVQTQNAEQKVEKWLEDFEGIVQEAKPAVEARNRRIERAYHAHQDEEEEIFEEGVEDLEHAQEEYEEEVMHAQQEFEQAVHEQGLVAEWEQLVQEVQAEMEAANVDMKKSRLAVKSLKSKKAGAATSLTMSDDFHREAPTPEEVEEAENIIKEWFERGEQIMEDAKPGLEARDRRIIQAWERAEREEQQINEEMIDELIEAQEDFEDEVMDAEHNFEEELTQNGVVADWEALEDKIDADMRAMKKFNQKAISLKRRQAVMQRAQTKLNMNLARVSEEMARNPPNAAEWDALKTKLVDWTSRYESIAERAKPLEERRNREVMDATEDRAEEVEDTVEGMLEDWDKNDREFWDEVVAAEDAMLERWETQGTTQKIKNLRDEIHHSIEAAHQSTMAIKRNMNMRKNMIASRTQSLRISRPNKQLTHAQSLKLSEKLSQLPTGAKVRSTFDTVTGWVADYEAIEEKAEPAAQRRERALVDALEDRHEEVVDTLMDADRAHKQKEQRFWEDVMAAQHDFEVRMENEGIAARDRQLGEDIKAQFEEWGNMKRVRSSTSLKRDNKSAMRSLKALERDIDSILATL